MDNFPISIKSTRWQCNIKYHITWIMSLHLQFQVCLRVAVNCFYLITNSLLNYVLFLSFVFEFFLGSNLNIVMQCSVQFYCKDFNSSKSWPQVRFLACIGLTVNIYLNIVSDYRLLLYYSLFINSDTHILYIRWLVCNVENKT